MRRERVHSVSLKKIYEGVENDDLDLPVLKQQSPWIKVPVNTVLTMGILACSGVLAYYSAELYWDYGKEGADKLPWGGNKFNEKVSGPASFATNALFNFYYMVHTLLQARSSWLRYRLQRQLGIPIPTKKLIGKLTGAILIAVMAMYPTEVLSNITESLLAKIATAIVNIVLNIIGAYTIEEYVIAFGSLLYQSFSWLGNKAYKRFWNNSERTPLLPENEASEDIMTKDHVDEASESIMTKDQALKRLTQRHEEIVELDNQNELFTKNLYDALDIHSKNSRQGSTKQSGLSKIASKGLLLGLHGVIQFCGLVSLWGLYFNTRDACAKSFKINNVPLRYLLGSFIFSPALGLTLLINTETINEIHEGITATGKKIVDTVYCKDTPKRQSSYRTGYFYHIINPMLEILKFVLIGVGIVAAYESASTTLELNNQYGLHSTPWDEAASGGIVVFNGYTVLILVLLMFVHLKEVLFFSTPKRRLVNKANQLCSFIRALPDDVKINNDVKIEKTALDDERAAGISSGPVPQLLGEGQGSSDEEEGKIPSDTEIHSGNNSINADPEFEENFVDTENRDTCCCC